MKRLFRFLPKFLQKRFLQILYFRNGKQFEDFEVHGNWKYFIYKVNGVYVPSESLGWFVDYKYYEKRMDSMATFHYKPKEGDTIIDIGAGMGEEAIVFANITGQNGRVFSIEANPQIYFILNRVLELNKINNVKTYNIAISESDAPITISVNDASYLGGSIDHVSGKKQENAFTVNGFRLDTFLSQNEIENIDLLKVNIEGAERYVIATMDAHIKKIKNIAIECHDFRFKSEKDEFFKTKELVSNYLERKGFHVFSQKTGISYIDDWIYAYPLQKN